jgi:hypothetical protein
MTANLQINYCKPVQAWQFLVLRAQTTKVEGRKGWAEGWIESLDVPEGQAKEKLVEGSALFLGPKTLDALAGAEPDYVIRIFLTRSRVWEVSGFEYHTFSLVT